ncbi:hypothetical protein C8J56DRAFT_1076666 [Mycena floridula]|nr:hypothetical protein C8J56DRAFT_1076666 [Mycena floridula]
MAQVLNMAPQVVTVLENLHLPLVVKAPTTGGQGFYHRVTILGTTSGHRVIRQRRKERRRRLRRERQKGQRDETKQRERNADALSLCSSANPPFATLHLAALRVLPATRTRVWICLLRHWHVLFFLFDAHSIHSSFTNARTPAGLNFRLQEWHAQHEKMVVAANGEGDEGVNQGYNQTGAGETYGNQRCAGGVNWSSQGDEDDGYPFSSACDLANPPPSPLVMKLRSRSGSVMTQRLERDEYAGRRRIPQPQRDGPEEGRCGVEPELGETLVYTSDLIQRFEKAGYREVPHLTPANRRLDGMDLANRYFYVGRAHHFDRQLPVTFLLLSTAIGMIPIVPLKPSSF